MQPLGQGRSASHNLGGGGIDGALGGRGASRTFSGGGGEGGNAGLRCGRSFCQQHAQRCKPATGVATSTNCWVARALLVISGGTAAASPIAAPLSAVAAFTTPSDSSTIGYSLSIVFGLKTGQYFCLMSIEH